MYMLYGIAGALMLVAAGEFTNRTARILAYWSSALFFVAMLSNMLSTL